MSFNHISVLRTESVDALIGGRENFPGELKFIDGTFGGGGHSRLLLERLPQAKILGIDCDSMALAEAKNNFANYGTRLILRQGKFSQMERLAAEIGWSDGVDGILLDIGVSSPQIDTPERGFSFRYDGPLDMRMDTSCGMTAADLLNTLTENELADIFFQYGEEKKSRLIARKIVERRKITPWKHTTELKDLLEHTIGMAHQHGLPPATRVFQALRIAVNDELQELERALTAAENLLRQNGRLAVISFHSLEDRIVKHFLQHAASSCTCPPGMPICTCGKIKTFEILNKKPIEASENELNTNRRAACAKLRCAVRIK